MAGATSPHAQRVHWYAETMIVELGDAAGGWNLPDADWTEGLFHRAQLTIVIMRDRISELEGEVNAKIHS